MKKPILLSICITAILFTGYINKCNAQTNTQEYKRVLKQSYKKLVDNNFVTRRKDDNYYVNAVYWRIFNAKQKEQAVLTLARYHGFVIYDQDHAMGIYVKDNHTGKTLATYGIWEGVEIK